MIGDRKNRWATFGIITGIITGIIAAVAVWDSFWSKISQTTAGLTEALNISLYWFSETVSTPIPRWLILFVVVLISVILIAGSHRLLEERSRKRTRCDTHRGMRLFYWTVDEVPNVLNRTLDEARCDTCNKRIIGTDVGKRSVWVQYLVCEDGHYIGGKIPYSEYKQRLDEARERSEQENALRQERAAQAVAQLELELKQGKITQKEFYEILYAPPEAKTSSIVRSYVSGPTKQHNAASLYAEIIDEYEQKFVRQKLDKIKKQEP